MNTQLNFFDTLLSQARRRQLAGQPNSAINLLSRMTTYPDLPPDRSAEVHVRLGELHLKARRFHKARRYLRNALAIVPDSARLHHRLGWVMANDQRGKTDLALRHYRRAIDLAPDQTRWRAEAGLLAVRMGRIDEGLSLLRQAHEQSPDDATILGRFVKGLCQAGQPDEALRVVRLARFRAPRCERMQKMHADLLLAQLRRKQETANSKRENEGPVLLPFVRAVADEKPSAELRSDGPQSLPGPHLVHVRARAGRRVT